MLLPDATIEVARRVCERIRVALGREHLLSGEAPFARVTVSIGVAPIGRDATAAAVLEAADLALYQAKGAGRDRLALAA